jgi:hypothetical protein
MSTVNRSDSLLGEYSRIDDRTGGYTLTESTSDSDPHARVGENAPVSTWRGNVPLDSNEQVMITEEAQHCTTSVPEATSLTSDWTSHYTLSPSEY